jgi:hypothetical protein
VQTLPGEAAGRLARGLLVAAVCWSVVAGALGLWNIGVPPRMFDLLRRANTASWLLSGVFFAGAGTAFLAWALEPGFPRRAAWLGAGAALLFLSLDAVSGLQVIEIPRLLTHWGYKLGVLDTGAIDGDEFPPVTAPLAALAGILLIGSVAALRGERGAYGCGIGGLAALGLATFLHLRLLEAHAARPSPNTLALIDACRLAGGVLFLWACTLRARTLLTALRA